MDESKGIYSNELKVIIDKVTKQVAHKIGIDRIKEMYWFGKNNR